jgi:serine protease inhibitor
MEDRGMGAAINRFGFKLLAQAAGQEPGKNLLISPYSVAAALAMTGNGAAGETRQAMAEVLEVAGLDLAEVNRAHARLMESLAGADGVQLAIANSLWARAGFPFRAEFVQVCRELYQAQATALDFDQQAVATINGWVSDRTQGKIERMIDTIDPLTILFLLNALYFKGRWRDPFDPAETRGGTFTLANGRRARASMMAKPVQAPCLAGPGFRAARLPYGDGRIGMVLLLPDEGTSLASFQAGLTAERWQEWLAGFQEMPAFIMLPRFKLETKILLNSALAKLGMAVAFDDRRADFGQMCPISSPGEVYIARVLHKTVVEVNEEGTEAAASTLVEMRLRAAPPPPFNLIIDRPFLLAIDDQVSGAILFVGPVWEV